MQYNSRFMQGGFCLEAKPQPCGFILFGASGDLAARKIIPSLFGLYRRGLLRNFWLLGAARSPLSNEQFREKVRALAAPLAADGKQTEDFLSRVFYEQGRYDDKAFYERLFAREQQIRRTFAAPSNRIIHFATPPEIFTDIANGLAEANLACEAEGFCRFVLEKPFGRNRENSRALAKLLAEKFGEDRIYRIDHYLGKETVQNIMMLRFANSVFEPLWNAASVESVQITAAETLGVENRAGYFEKNGTLLDMFQSHMLRLMAVVAMEPPKDFQAESLRDETVRALKTVLPPEPKNVVLGQYDEGALNGKPLIAYRQERGVAKNSQSETFVAAKLFIDNPRWRGVPFYLRTGKRLPEKSTKIILTLKPSVFTVFPGGNRCFQNTVTLNIEPEEGASITLNVKLPGPKLCTEIVPMTLRYAEAGNMPSAYERLLLDAVIGDQSLFVRSDNMDTAWALTDPLLEAKAKGGLRVQPYPAGTWGPRDAQELPHDGWTGYDS